MGLFKYVCTCNQCGSPYWFDDSNLRTVLVEDRNLSAEESFTKSTEIECPLCGNTEDPEDDECAVKISPTFRYLPRSASLSTECSYR